MFDPQKPHICGSRNTLTMNTKVLNFLAPSSRRILAHREDMIVLLLDVALLLLCFSLR